ncbi:MAG: DUF4105 domain-containing protein [Adhaeribacter sp.]
MNQTFIKPILITCCLLFHFLNLPAQGLPPLSEGAEISLITVSPGAELYSMYGHSAIRVNDPARGVDYVFNYGTFDFNTPNFYVKFVRGKLPYQLSVGYFEDLKSHSIRDNRSVVEQVLNLEAAEKQKVLDLLATNYQPENRSYLYDFFFDNCATRIRDVFERGMGKSLQFSDAPAPNPRSFRQLVGIYQNPHPWVDLGVDLVMGLPSDALASPRQTMFLPDYLMAQFDQARVKRGAGQAAGQAFVKETRQLFKASATSEPASLRRPTVVCWSLLVILAVYTFYQVRQRQSDHTLDILLFGITGFLGLVLLFLWFGTDHASFAGNLNLLWALPLHLPMALMLLRRTKPKALRTYFLAVAALSALLLISWPFFPQQFHQAVFPLILLLGLRAWFVWRSGQPKSRNPYK